MSGPSGRVLIVGEFGAGALALAYARAFEALGWQTTRYDMQAGYTRGAVLARARGATSAPLAMLYPDSPYGAYVQRLSLIHI